MTAPLTTISYRIQSVDFLTYIERPSNATSAEMRPFKNSTRQQWNFVDAGSNTYYIQNVKLSDEYLGYTIAGVVYATTQSSATKWTVALDGDSYFIKDSNAYRFQTDATSQVKAINTGKGYDNERWNLLPVNSPPIENTPLATGYYRIRSFNGLYLMTMPSGDSSTEDESVFIKSQESSSLKIYQRWLVTRQADGLYVILNSGSKSYMGRGTGCDAQGDYITSVATADEWSLQSTGLPSSFLISLPSSQLSLGFGNYSVESDQGVSLEVSDSIPSQLWFFEKYVAFGDEQVHAQRWSSIGEGNYQLQNCHDPTVYMNYIGSPPRIQSGSAVGKSKFSLAYKSNSPNFTLTYNETDTTSKSTIPHPLTVVDVNGCSYLSCGTTATDWVLLKENDDDPGFYICKPDAGYPRRVISSRLYTAADRNNYFAIDDMTEGDAMQMWNLNLVPA